MASVGKIMEEALLQARAALSEGEVPVGAVLVRDGTIVARAHNRVEALDDPTAHAELLCIREAAKTLGRRLDGCTLYVTVKPCPMCMGAIANARISRLVYGAEGAVEAALPDIAGGVLREECAGLMREAFGR